MRKFKELTEESLNWYEVDSQDPDERQDELQRIHDMQDDIRELNRY